MGSHRSRSCGTAATPVLSLYGHRTRSREQCLLHSSFRPRSTSMNAHELVPARCSEVVFTAFTGWIDTIARHVIERAAGRTPAILSDRLREEWMADLLDRQGPFARWRFALGCTWAAMIIQADCRTVSSPAARVSSLGRVIKAHRRYGTGLSLAQITTSGSAALMCD